MRVYKIKYIHPGDESGYRFMLRKAKNVFDAVDAFVKEFEKDGINGWLDIEFIETIREDEE